ncbi:MAG: zinc finger domain-containing protein [Candidatus Woesearchaeota archaeon]
MALTCVSCKSPIVNQTGSVRFLCPACGKYEIIRCRHCRVLGAKYGCVCGFEGPN